jgi:hypothetical protein
MVRTFLKVYMELGSYFLFLQEQIKDIIIIIRRRRGARPPLAAVTVKVRSNIPLHQLLLGHRTVGQHKPEVWVCRAEEQLRGANGRSTQTRGLGMSSRRTT